VLSPSTDYTDRDFDSLRARLISLIKSIPNFSGWTDFSYADIGNILAEAFCFTGDVLHFNLDAAAREAKWGTAQQLRSILRSAKMIGYQAKGQSAATTSETISATDTLMANVVVPAGTKITTKGIPAIEFQTLNAITLTQAAPSASVDVENSESVTETWEPATDAFQTRALGHDPYLPDSLVRTTTQGTWVEVLNFLASRAVDLHYTLEVDASGRAVTTCGDGRSGALPVGTVTDAYRVGGGAINVGPGELSEIQGSFFDALGTQVTLAATNASKAVGGAERETVAAIKVKAPASLRAGNRTVSREDFEYRARQAAGVGRCLMLTRLQDPLVELNCGMLWAVPQGLGFLTPTIRSAITAQYAKYPYAPTFILDIRDPSYLDVSISAKVYLQGTAKAAVVKAAILANLQAWFAISTTDAAGNVVDNPNIDFGYYVQDAEGAPTGLLAYSDLFNVVRDSAGVRKIGGYPEDFLLTSVRTTTAGSVPVATSVHADLEIWPRDFPRFVSVSLVNGDTGEAL